MVIYWLNPWFLFENTLWNPSYLSFFTAVHFWAAFHMQQKKSFWYSFLHLLAIGMAVQLHYSWPILAVISSFLFYRGIIKIHWLGLVDKTLKVAPNTILLVNKQDAYLSQ
jgi:signal transduction histidine kinase